MIILDTHVLIWVVHDNRHKRLGSQTRVLIENAMQSGLLAVSAITPWEIAMLVEKGRLSFGIDVTDWLKTALDPACIKMLPIEPDIAVDSVNLPNYPHKDPADRLIIATARHVGAKLLTADQKILDYADAGYLDAFDVAK